MATSATPPASLWCEIKAYWIVEATGKHAQRYLQSRGTFDVRLVKPGFCALSAALNPQGKTEALYTIGCLAENSYLLVGDGSEESQIVAALSRYIVADRISLKSQTARYRCYHCLGALKDVSEQSLPGPTASAANRWHRGEGFFYLPRKRLHETGFDIIIEQERAAALEQSLIQQLGEPACFETFEFWRICAGIPSFPSELNPHRNFMEGYPQSCLSFDKGCYAGQEVVEKVSALGKAPRVFLPISFAPGTKIDVSAEVRLKREASPEPGPAIGTVTSAAVLGQTSMAFASIKNDPDLLNGPFMVQDCLGQPVAIR